MTITSKMTCLDSTEDIINEWKTWRDQKRQEYDYKQALKLNSLKKRYAAACAADPSVADFHRNAKRYREDKEHEAAEFRFAQAQHLERTAGSGLDGLAAVHECSDAPHMTRGSGSTDAPPVSVVVPDCKFVFEEDDEADTADVGS